MSTQRDHERVQISGVVRLYWEDERGVQHHCRAEAKDVSSSGLSVTLRERLPLRSMVQWECEGNKSKGPATVRRCEQRGMNYLVGLEFMGGSRPASKMGWS